MFNCEYFCSLANMKCTCMKRYRTNNKTAKSNVLSRVFSEYCIKTSVHGIGYLGDSDKSHFEKVWWIIVFVLSVVACVIQISNIWTKWNENPVIVSVSETQIPIWKIPFPAVTICPFNKIDRRSYQYREKYLNRYNLPENEDKKFWDVSLLCNLKTYNYTRMTDEGVIDHIMQVSTTSKYIIQWAKLNGKYIRFYDQITEDGLCYTYNSFNQNDIYTDQLNPETKLIYSDMQNEGWSIENGYPEDTESYRTYPNRTKDGAKFGMHILLLSYTISKELACGEPVLGYKITLHNPMECPRGGQQYILAPIKKSTIISVKPKAITTSKNLKIISKHTRQCYFSDEKSLRFFKVYTQDNCRSECVVNVTKEYCGCVAFYMPRDNTTKICGTVDCVNDLETDILPEFDVVRSNNRKQFNNLETSYKIYTECDCLPSCASLDYDYDSSQADYDWIEGFKSKQDVLRAQMPLAWYEYTSVNIFFKEPLILALHRKELYGQTDFLANCGGLLGLFMGFSFLSLMEIIYYLTVRFWCHLNHNEMQTALSTEDIKT